MKLIKALAIAAVTGAALPALATTYDFQTVGVGTIGDDLACTGSDRCADAVGGSMSFFAGAVSARGYYKSSGNWNPVVSMLDNFSDRADTVPTKNLNWVGLGVYHKKLTTDFEASDDNITKDEALVLTFTSAVKLTDITLRADGHFAEFKNGAKFGVSTSLTGPQTQFNLTNGQNLYNISSMNVADSTTWVFFGYSNTKTEQFYVSSITAVPEPSTYALMFAGLAAVGFVARRRRQS